MAKQRASMTPEQWENQRQAAIDIMGPDPFFDKMRAEEEEADKKAYKGEK